MCWFYPGVWRLRGSGWGTTGFNWSRARLNDWFLCLSDLGTLLSLVLNEITLHKTVPVWNLGSSWTHDCCSKSTWCLYLEVPLQNFALCANCILDPGDLLMVTHALVICWLDDCNVLYVWLSLKRLCKKSWYKLLWYEQLHAFLGECMLELCSVNCIGYQFVSRSNSRCWPWKSLSHELLFPDFICPFY